MLKFDSSKTNTGSEVRNNTGSEVRNHNEYLQKSQFNHAGNNLPFDDIDMPTPKSQSIERFQFSKKTIATPETPRSNSVKCLLETDKGISSENVNEINPDKEILIGK